MNYEKSTQKRMWTIPNEVSEWRSEKERRLIEKWIRYMYKSQSGFGLESTRKAFVTATFYFHRYFAVNAIEDHPDPRLIAITCLYTASKVEEVPWRKYTHGSLQYRGFEARRICSAIPEISMDELIECELELLETLGFSLLVHSTQPRPQPNSDDEKRETLMLMTTRACLTMTPSDMGQALNSMDLMVYKNLVDEEDPESEGM